MSLIAVPEGSNALDVLAQRYRAAFAKTKAGRAQWIEGMLELSTVIKEAKRLPELQNSRAYSRWLKQHDLREISHQDLSALNQIGKLDPSDARKLLEETNLTAPQHIWAKRPNKPPPTLSLLRKGPPSRKSGHAKRNRIPDVMRDDNPPKPERKGVVLKALTPDQVDPDFKGTPLEFTTKYGHVLLQTKEQINYHKQQELLMAWISTATEFERAGRAMLAALPAVDPAALKEWMAKPGKADKINAWSKSVQIACEALYNMISNV